MTVINSYHEEIKEDVIIRFEYTNWKGVKSERKALVKGFFFGRTEYHPEYQCFIRAFDLDKLKIRTFAVKDISALEVYSH